LSEGNTNNSTSTEDSSHKNNNTINNNTNSNIDKTSEDLNPNFSQSDGPSHEVTCITSNSSEQKSSKESVGIDKSKKNSSIESEFVLNGIPFQGVPVVKSASTNSYLTRKQIEAEIVELTAAFDKKAKSSTIDSKADSAKTDDKSATTVPLYKAPPRVMSSSQCMTVAVFVVTTIIAILTGTHKSLLLPLFTIRKDDMIY
jgi:hypothetical protein